MRLNHGHRWIALLAVLVASLTDLYSSATIVERSPFVPTGFDPRANPSGTAAVSSDPGSFSFRGLYVLEDHYWFLIGDPQGKQGRWLELGKAYDGLEVRHYDPSTTTLVLYSNNKEHRLILEDLEANPTPIPVKTATRTNVRKTADPRPTIRRTIRSSPRNRAEAPEPPEWLAKLREEAAKRRAEQAKAEEQEANSPENQ